MSSSSIAFFGGTGGCAGYCLSFALNAGYTCIALARTPDKLTKSLEEKDVKKDLITSNLIIVQGDIHDQSAVERVLAPNGKLVGKIVNGIGSYPVMKWSLTNPVDIVDPTICRDASSTIRSALKTIQKNAIAPGQVGATPATKPFLINVSTTGIPAPGCPQDVPFALRGLYGWVLHAPHQDKAGMEQDLREHMAQSDVEEKVLGGFVNVKASLLMDGKGKGWKGVKAGGEKTPAVGYTIARKDVGEWIFETVIQGDGWQEEWMNSSVCITN